MFSNYLQGDLYSRDLIHKGILSTCSDPVNGNHISVEIQAVINSGLKGAEILGRHPEIMEKHV